MDINTIFPLIVPASYYNKGTWDLPHYPLPNNSFILTWVIFGSPTNMSYLNEERYHDLNNYEHWQQHAFENLRYSITDGESLATHFKMSDDEQRLLYIVFMHKDGIGSGRMLLSGELKRCFPGGYYVAFPDRSCGLAIAKNTTKRELRTIQKMIKNMYKGATTAMSPLLYEPEEFALPEEWLKPIDIDFSKRLTEQFEQ